MKMFKLTMAAVTGLILLAGTAMAGTFDLDKNVRCTPGTLTHSGVTLSNGDWREDIQFPSAATAANVDVSNCNGAVIPASVDYKRQDEIIPWLASQGYTDFTVTTVGGECMLRDDQLDPDGFGSCYENDLLAGSVGDNRRNGPSHTNWWE